MIYATIQQLDDEGRNVKINDAHYVILHEDEEV